MSNKRITTGKTGYLEKQENEVNTNGLINNDETLDRQWTLEDYNSNIESRPSTVIEVVPTPPDGGYGWVIVIAAFYCNFVVDGICYAFGNLRPVLQNKFANESEASVAFIGSSLIGTYLLVGPVVSGLVNRFGPKIVVAIGGSFACIAFLASTLITNVYAMIVVYGIFGGIGLGFIYLPAIVVVCFFFEKKRSLATGIAVAGSGAGNMIMPQIVALLQKSGISINCVVLAGFAVSCILVGMSYKMPSGQQVRENSSDKTFTVKKSSRVKMQWNPYPTEERQSPFKLVTQSMGDIPVIKETRRSERLSLVSDNIDINYKCLKRSVREYAQSVVGSLKSRRSDLDVSPRPLNRANVFFIKSTENLAEIDQEVIPNHDRRIEFTTSGGDLKPRQRVEKVSRDGKKLSSFEVYIRLIKEPVLIILIISNILAMLGFYVPFVFPADLALSKGVPYDDAKLLISIIGLFNTLGRLLFGWLADRKWLTALTLNNLALVCCGILTILCPFCHSYALLLTYSILFGTFGAAYICLTSIVLTDWLGLDSLTNAFGILVLGRSIGCFFGTPLAGAIKDATAAFDYPFYFSGVLLLLGGLISCLIPVFGKTREEKGSSVSVFGLLRNYLPSVFSGLLCIGIYLFLNFGIIENNFFANSTSAIM